MKKRKFADGGETTEMVSNKPEGGRFDEDTYSRARRFVESGGKKEETKTAVKRARKVETDPTAGEAKDKAAQRAADMEGETSTPAKRPGMMARLRADSAMREAAVRRMREETPDLSARVPSVSNPMAKDYGVGRVNPNTLLPYKKGGSIKKYASGGSVSSVSKRADGIATKGKTKCKVY